MKVQCYLCDSPAAGRHRRIPLCSDHLKDHLEDTSPSIPAIKAKVDAIDEKISALKDVRVVWAQGTPNPCDPNDSFYVSAPDFEWRWVKADDGHISGGCWVEKKDHL